MAGPELLQLMRKMRECGVAQPRVEITMVTVRHQPDGIPDRDEVVIRVMGNAEEFREMRMFLNPDLLAGPSDPLSFSFTHAYEHWPPNEPCPVFEWYDGIKH